MGCLAFLVSAFWWLVVVIVVVVHLLYKLGKWVEQEKDRQFDREHPEAKARSAPEGRLKRIVAEMFPEEWEPEYSPRWLDRQQIDAAVPAKRLAFDYNGKQHYEFIEHFHETRSGFERQEERDRRKAAQLKQHGWTLIVVPYWEEDRLGEGYLRSKLRAANVALGSSPPQAQPQDLHRCWGIRRGDSNAGPYTEDQLIRLMRRGKLVSSAWVRRASGGPWRHLRQVAIQDSAADLEEQSDN